MKLPGLGNIVCPHCRTLIQYDRKRFFVEGFSPSMRRTYFENTFGLGYVSCISCNEVFILRNKQIIYPKNVQNNVDSPCQDLSEEVKNDYIEASDILNLSPRGSCAILRLCIEKICDTCKAKGNSLDKKIGWLVQNQGLRSDIQKALDTVRVIGNEAVHPGVLDLKDDLPTAQQLFVLVNFVADELLTKRKILKEMYKRIPKEKKKAIEERDKK